MPFLWSLCCVSVDASSCFNEWTVQRCIPECYIFTFHDIFISFVGVLLGFRCPVNRVCFLAVYFHFYSYQAYLPQYKLN